MRLRPLWFLSTRSRRKRKELGYTMLGPSKLASFKFTVHGIQELTSKPMHAELTM